MSLFFKKNKKSTPSLIDEVREKVKEMEQNGEPYFYIVVPENEYKDVYAWCSRNGISMLASHITDGRITYLFRKIK